MGCLSRLELSGPWQLLPVQDFSGAYPAEASWHVQELPAHWQEVDALATHTGKVVYRKAFPWPVDQTPEGKVILRLRGVFYRFNVRLNGHAVGSAEGYFFPHEFDVADVLQQDNELIVEVDSPVERSKSDKETITGVFAHWDALSSYKYNAGGLWLPVELEVHPDVRIKHAMLHLESFDDQVAHVRVGQRERGERAGVARGAQREARESVALRGGPHDALGVDADALVGVALGLGADRVDASVGAAALGELQDAVVDVRLHEVDRLGSRLARQLQPLWHGVDGEHPLGAEEEGAADR